ncbi:MAG: hypothetical protein HPM95_15205 [Alphaproteobacteria bacterium]|nr:hypothetical protein [Alphaproteobacteria bacterium]
MQFTILVGRRIHHGTKVTQFIAQHSGGLRFESACAFADAWGAPTFIEFANGDDFGKPVFCDSLHIRVGLRFEAANICMGNGERSD